MLEEASRKMLTKKMLVEDSRKMLEEASRKMLNKKMLQHLKKVDKK
jgi:hypothetical protein